MKWLKFISMFLFVSAVLFLLPSQYGGYGAGTRGTTLAEVLSAISDSTYWRMEGSALEYEANSAVVQIKSTSTTSGANVYLRGRNGTLQAIFGTGGVNNEFTLRANAADGGFRFDTGGANQRFKIEADGDIVLNSISGEKTLPSSPVNGTLQFLNADDSNADTLAFFNGTGWWGVILDVDLSP